MEAPGKTVIVVGGGLAGLMTTIKVAEAGYKAQLFSIVPVKRSHSVCAQGGINAAKNIKGENDSTWEHFDDTIYGGDFLANQTPVKNMCEAAPGIIDLLDRMGVMFNRTPEGFLDFRRFGGTRHHRTAYAGATTGQQLLYALDEQVRRFEAAGLVKKFELWEFLSVVLDDGGRARGITAVDMRTMTIQAFPANAVVVCTGGPGLVYGGNTTLSVMCTGGAAGSLHRQGAKFANGEFIQVHPTAIPGTDKCRLMSESARGEGGRVWTYKDGKPWYFLEEMYPAYGNLVPRDIATRAIFKVCTEMRLGVDGKNQVYLDLTHKDPHELDVKLGGILEIYEKFVGEDPRKYPMKIFPAVHYSMGGLWVDFDQQTNIPGVFAAGECEYQYHGANRLGANSLLSCIYGGSVAGPNAVACVNAQAKSEIAARHFEQEVARQEEVFRSIYSSDGGENPYRIWREMGDMMNENVTIVRYNDKLRATDEKLLELQDRYRKITIEDKSRWSNQSALFARQLGVMLDLARVITIGALRRDESRGAHYKPDFPDRDDARFLKTTIAKWTKTGPEFSYEEVDTQHIKPRERKYDVAKTAA